MAFDAPAESDIGFLILHGLGVEGLAALPHFIQHTTCPVMVIDTAEKTAALPYEIRSNPRLTLASEQAFSLPGDIDLGTALYLRSPGIAPDNAVFTAVRQAGIRHTTPTGYWLARHAPVGTITITGTKGKSSTASLTASLLRWGGIDAQEMGNIGRTPFEAAPGPETLCVFELSSYMMHDLPNAAIFHVVTSLYHEHTDWHGTHEAYAADKLRPFFFDPPAPGLMAQAVMAYVKARPDAVALLEDIAPLHDGVLTLRAGPDSPLTLRPRDLNEAFRAPSMVLALRAAVATCLAHGLLAPDAIHDALSKHLPGWRGLECRQEIIGSADGRIWVNDALATVPEATLSALTRWGETPVSLILGGKNRGQDFATLIAACAVRGDVRLFVFDEVGPTLLAAAGNHAMGGRAHRFDTLEEAIEAAAQAASAGELVLFSPAAPSSAIHGNYKIRAQIFNRLAQTQQAE